MGFYRDTCGICDGNALTSRVTPKIKRVIKRGICGISDRTVLTSRVTLQIKRVIKCDNWPINTTYTHLLKISFVSVDRVEKPNEPRTTIHATITKESTTSSNTMEPTRRMNDETNPSNRSFKRNSAIRKSMSSWFDKEPVLGDRTVKSNSIQHEDFTRTCLPSHPPCEPARSKKTCGKCTIC